MLRAATGSRQRTYSITCENLLRMYYTLYEIFCNFISTATKLDCHDRIGKVRDKCENLYRNYKIVSASIYIYIFNIPVICLRSLFIT